MSTNAQLRIGTAGAFGTLALHPVPRRAPGAGEVEVEVLAAGLNFKDVLTSIGLLGPEAAARPLGSEFAGRVAAVGTGVVGCKPGDRVMGLAPASFSRFLTVAADGLVATPANLTDEQAAGLPAAYVTAHYVMECARVAPGDSVLVHAATGGVGLALVHLAKAAGARLLATAGNDEKRAHLRALGIEHVMDSRSLSFAEGTRLATGGRGVDVVVNSLSGEFAKRSVELLAPYGRFIELGIRDILEGRPLDLAGFLQGATYCAVGSGSGFPRTPERLREIATRVGRGELPALPCRTFPVAQAAAAFEHMARARHIGKVVLALAAPVNAKAAAMADFIRPAEGVEVFLRALGRGLPHVVVSTHDLAPRLAGSRPPSAKAGPTAADLHPRPPLDTPFAAPSTAQEIELAGHWKQFLRIEPVGVNDDFFALGGDSLLAVQLLAQVRKAMKVDLPAHALVQAPTIAALAALLPTRGGMQQRKVPGNLVPLKKGAPGVAPLFLFPPVGGQVYVYRDLAVLLDDRIPVWAIQAEVVAGDDSLEALAARYLAQVRELHPGGPWRLAGSSLGGVLAYEAAQQLLAAGERVGLLGMFDSPAPEACPQDPGADADLMAYLLGQEPLTADERERLMRLSLDERIAHFSRSQPERSRLAPSADELRSLLALWNANVRALRGYQPRPYPGRVVFFRATRSDGYNRNDYQVAWQRLAGKVDLHAIDDTHVGINLLPGARILASELAPFLTLPQS